MKKKGVICISCLCFCAVMFSIGYVIGYSIEINYGSVTAKVIPTVEVSAVNQVTVDSSTKLIVEELDLEHADIKYTEITVPREYIGLTRKQLTDRLKEEMKNLSAQERADNLIAKEVISFSKSQVIIRKTYESIYAIKNYYLYNEKGKIAIYLDRGNTLYDYTDIQVDSLDYYTQYQLNRGMRIEGTDKLFEFLQNCTS